MPTTWRRLRAENPKTDRAVRSNARVCAILLLFSVAVFGALVASPPPAGAAGGDYWYAGGWPLLPHDVPDMGYSVARDSAGNIFVSDEYNSTIQKFDSAGHPLQTWGAIFDTSMFQFPRGMTFDAAGNLYVADKDNFRISRMSPTGIWSVFYDAGSYYFPTDVAFDGVGTFYATVWNPLIGYYYVRKLSSSGAELLTWGGNHGTGAGAFQSPMGIACDTSGHVYVADTGNNRIQKFDSDGHFLMQWGTSLNGPRGLACDSAGDVIVSDTGNDRVVEFTPEGTLLTTVGGLGTGSGKFNAPDDVACGPAGTIWVTDANNQRLQRFARDTTAPVTAATCQPAGWTVAFVTVTLAATDDLSGVQSTVYKIGAGAWTPYTGPVVVDTVGTTPVSFHSSDVAGNVEADKTVIASIDRKGPAIRAVADVTVKRGKTATFRFRITDLTPTAKVAIRIFKGSKVRKTLAVGSKRTGSTQSYRWKCTLAVGTYTWRVYATDLAGNPQRVIGKKTLVVE